jgi:hypothetical protein
MALVIGAMYIGGGTAAIRRQVPQLVLFAAVLAPLPFAVPFLSSALGDLWDVALLGLNVVVVAALVRQARRRQGSPVAERRRAALRLPAFRRLLVVWIVANVVGMILLILAAKAGY